MSEKSGFCVYLFTHGGGAGRKISETNNMKQTKTQLRGADVRNIVCDVDKRMAIRKYNALIKKQKDIKSKKPKKKPKNKSKNKSKKNTMRGGR